MIKLQTLFNNAIAQTVMKFNAAQGLKIRFGKMLGGLGLIFGLLLNGVAWADDVYSFESPSWDGTGKIYMGREIAPVMGYQGAGWLERSSRNREESVDKLIQMLPLSEKDVVADIGAGTGYLSFRLALRVPQGQVFAVDVQSEMVEILSERTQQSANTNVLPIKGDEKTPNLEPESIDLALMVDVYHELEYPREMLRAIADSLRPGGKLVLAEYKAENPRVMIKPLHKMSQAQVKAEMDAAGFSFERSLKGLPQQHLMVFSKTNLNT